MKFKVELELEIDNIEKYVAVPYRTQAHLNELAKAQIEIDVNEVVRQYGMNAKVTLIRKATK
jgi:hypothetical protein